MTPQCPNYGAHLGIWVVYRSMAPVVFHPRHKRLLSWALWVLDPSRNLWSTLVYFSLLWSSLVYIDLSWSGRVPAFHLQVSGSLTRSKPARRPAPLDQGSLHQDLLGQDAPYTAGLMSGPPDGHLAGILCLFFRVTKCRRSDVTITNVNMGWWDCESVKFE